MNLQLFGMLLLTGQDGRYELVEPLMAGHQALLRLLDQPAALITALEDQARSARKASRLMHAQSALLQLQLSLRQLAARSAGRAMLAAMPCMPAHHLTTDLRSLLGKADTFRRTAVSDVVSSLHDQHN